VHWCGQTFFCFGLPKLTLDVVINVVDIILSSGSPELFPFVDLAQFWLAAYYSYAGCHLILHLRSVNSSLSSLSSFTDCADLEARFKVAPPPAYNSSSGTIISRFGAASRATTHAHISAEGDDIELKSYEGPKAV
jgi:hypothetical protein